jgi:hypothetical protein
MTTEEKIELITRNLEETLTQEELTQLVDSGKTLRHYIGYEVSGKLHIGQGLYTLMKIKDLQDAGVHTIVFIADWHAWLNKKLDGKLETATWIGWLGDFLTSPLFLIMVKADGLAYYLNGQRNRWKMGGIASVTT